MARSQRKSAFTAVMKSVQQQNGETVAPVNSGTVEQQDSETVRPLDRSTVEHESSETPSLHYGETAEHLHSNTVTRRDGETAEQLEKTSFYLGTALLEKLDDLAHDYRKATGQRVNRNDIVRHLVERCSFESLSGLKPLERQKGSR